VHCLGGEVNQKLLRGLFKFCLYLRGVIKIFFLFYIRKENEPLPETRKLPNVWGYADCILPGTQQRRSLSSVQNTLDKKDSTKNYFVDSHKKVHGKKTYLLSTLVLAHDKELFCCVLFLTDGKNICCRVCFLWSKAKP
jgi:hypothetical protein